MEGWFGRLLAVPDSEKSGLYRVKADQDIWKILGNLTHFHHQNVC